MDILKQFPSRYLNVQELEEMGGAFTGPITKIGLEEMKNQAGQTEKKPVMHLEGLKSAIVINKSNAISLAEKLGRNTSSWVGKTVTLRLEQWGSAAQKKKWMALYVDGTLPAAPPSLDDLDDDVNL